jgi:hypothetical protein
MHNLNGLYTARIASTKPPRIVQLRDTTMDDNDRNLANMLCGILKECGCETRIPVKKYAYCEGRVFHKYKGKGVMLPAKLGMDLVM